MPREGKFNKNAARRVRVEGHDSARRVWREGAGHRGGGRSQADPAFCIRIPVTTRFSIWRFRIDETKAMIVDWQYEPIKGKLMHIDLKRIAMDKAMRVEVPILLEGMRDWRQDCRAAFWTRCCAKWRSSACRAISPAIIDLDVTRPGLGMVLRVADLPHADKLKFITPMRTHGRSRGRDQGRSGCAPTVEAVVAAAPAEPEVAKKGKRRLRSRLPKRAARSTWL